METPIEVLKLNKTLLNLMGLILSKNRTINKCIQFWNIILIAIQLCVWFPIFAHLIYIWGDISGTTDAMYTVCTFSMALEMYLIFVWRKIDLNRLLNELDRIIKRRKKDGDHFIINIKLCYRKVQNEIILIIFLGKNQKSIEMYNRTERKITLFTKNIIAIVTVVATACFLVPVGIVMFKYIRGNYTQDDWFYPLKVV